MRKFFWSRETEAETAPPAQLNRRFLLAERMAGGALPLPEALHYAILTAEALREVHARGRVYASLQPASISIDRDAVQLVLATPASVTPYQSPEQVTGRDLDLRSDIFALGALFYEMLSGRKAFGAASKPAVRFAILGDEPAPLVNIPPAVAQLTMRCLEKKPERRVQRMEILLAQLKLQAILASGPAAIAVTKAAD